MDHRIGIWNLLHDGEITAVSEQGSNLTMFVSIPYLRRRLSPMGDSFVLTLKGVKKLEFRNFDGKAELLADQLNIGAPEILGTDSNSVPVTVDTTLGQLMIDFDSVALAMDTGQVIDFETIDRTAVEYWTELEAKAAKAREP